MGKPVLLVGWMCMVCFCGTVFPAVEIREVQRGGKRTVEIENDLIRTVLVPEIARLPLSYFFKITGHEHFAHPAGLETPNRGFQYYGGIVDSLPWVGGSREKGLPDKGYLYSVPWTWTTQKRTGFARFSGEAQIEYPDPVTGQQSRLSFRKTVTGYDGSPLLRMDYRIGNPGTANARFTFSSHGRTAVAEWDAGDYFFAPGNRGYVYYSANIPRLERDKTTAKSWVDWPFPEATDFSPGQDFRNVFVFIPADWCMVGDEKHKETLFFSGGPIHCAGVESVMKMAVFMTNAAYLVEPCVTYSITSAPEEWVDPECTLVLKPGEECTFQLNLTAYQGISRREVEGIFSVHPESLLLEEPDYEYSEGKVFLRGKIAFAGKGDLLVTEGYRVILNRKVSPGVLDLKTLGCIAADPEKGLSLHLETAGGRRILYRFPWMKHSSESCRGTGGSP